MRAVWALLAAGAFTGLAGFYGYSFNLFYYMVFFGLLAAASDADIRSYKIPNIIIATGLVFALFVSCAAGAFLRSFEPLIYSAAGFVTGGAVLLAVILISRGGMGQGDMKLLAMAGAFLGWKPVLFTLLVAVIGGAFFGLGLIIFKGKGLGAKLPFGPFISLGGYAAVLLQQPVNIFVRTIYGLNGFECPDFADII